MEDFSTEIDRGFGNNNGSLPNAKTAMVLGIVACVFVLVSCCCMYIFFVPLILGIIAWVLGKNAMVQYDNSATGFAPSERQEAKAGYIMGIIATALSSLWVVLLILAIFLPVLGELLNWQPKF